MTFSPVPSEVHGLNRPGRRPQPQLLGKRGCSVAGSTWAMVDPSRHRTLQPAWPAPFLDCSARLTHTAKAGKCARGDCWWYSNNPVFYFSLLCSPSIPVPFPLSGAWQWPAQQLVLRDKGISVSDLVWRLLPKSEFPEGRTFKRCLELCLSIKMCNMHTCTGNSSSFIFVTLEIIWIEFSSWKQKMERTECHRQVPHCCSSFNLIL